MIQAAGQLPSTVDLPLALVAFVVAVLLVARGVRLMLRTFALVSNLLGVTAEAAAKAMVYLMSAIIVLTALVIIVTSVGAGA